jgi:hypothetical protein
MSVITRPFASLFFAVCFLVLVVAGLAAAANDPWKEKDPQDWDQKDVQKILSVEVTMP